MSKTVHRIYIGVMTAIVLAVTAYLFYAGWSYYQTPIEERFYHPNHDWFKPSGAYGHGLGIVGTFLILFGVVLYIARKRYNFMVRQLRLKYLLEFHIFLCTLGPIMVLFHTAFKFGGIVSIAFWSMVAVVLSGVIGRFIYIQIPRTIEGRELTLNEVKEIKNQLTQKLSEKIDLTELAQFQGSESGSNGGGLEIDISRKALKQLLNRKNISQIEKREILKMARSESSLSGKISRLQTMQRLFKYWHVAHLPFALIMLIIVIFHVGVTLAFGYRWIF